MIISGNLTPVGFGSQMIREQAYSISNTPVFGNGGMPTKGMSNMSDAEFKIAIENMAKRDFASNRNFAQVYYTSEFQNLMNNYVSLVSPDRRGIIDSTLSGFAGMMPMPNMNRYCLLNVLISKSNMFPNNINIGNNFINFTDSTGKVIAMYSQRPNGGMGWTHVPTEAENARSREFIRLYDEAWQNAQDELSTNVYNGNVQAQTEALNEYSRLALVVNMNASPENIAAKNAAQAAFEAATHRLVNIDIVGNKVITTSRTADADSIIAALERVAPGSTKQNNLNVEV
jgi:hypothetical protein